VKLVKATLLLGLGISCSVIQEDPPCVHPSCVEHLDIGRPADEVFTGSWAETEWRSAVFHGPVGRDLDIFFGYETIAPIAFEDDELFGWSHAFGPQSWRFGPRFSKLRYLEVGMNFNQVKRFRGPPRRVASFVSEGGEELRILSWRPSEMPLVMARLVEFKPLEEQWVLEEELTLRGYAVGFEDFLAE